MLAPHESIDIDKLKQEIREELENRKHQEEAEKIKAERLKLEAQTRSIKKESNSLLVERLISVLTGLVSGAIGMILFTTTATGNIITMSKNAFDIAIKQKEETLKVVDEKQKEIDGKQAIIDWKQDIIAWKQEEIHEKQKEIKKKQIIIDQKQAIIDERQAEIVLIQDFFDISKEEVKELKELYRIVFDKFVIDIYYYGSENNDKAYIVKKELEKWKNTLNLNININTNKMIANDLIRYSLKDEKGNIIRYYETTEKTQAKLLNRKVNSIENVDVLLDPASTPTPMTLSIFLFQ